VLRSLNLDLYEPFVGRNVGFIIEPETPAGETWRVIADVNGSRVELLGVKKTKQAP